MSDICLGDKVKDKVTGFVGVATCRTEFLNGCVQFGIAPKVGKDNKMPEPVDIDEDSLMIVRRKVGIIQVKKEVKKKRKSFVPPGGASRISHSQRGY